jgi:hypothetical protein
MRAGKTYRATTLVVLGVLVCGLTWLDGCGANVAIGGSSSSPAISGTVVDASTKSPITGALIVLEQPDPNGTDRIVTSTFSASDGTFGFNPSASGTFDVVADATIPTTGTPVTYAATVTFGVPAKASLGKIPLVQEFGIASQSGFPATIQGRATSSGTLGTPVVVDVNLSALQSVSPPVGSINQLTIPEFANSTATVTTAQNMSLCTSGTDCAIYTLIVPAGNFSFGTFNASGTQYTLSPQSQNGNVNYVVEGSAVVHLAPLRQDCTPSIVSSQIVLANGAVSSGSPDLTFTGCL